ncbi:hypothetical protein EW146_g2379 [Bondarzewia mesenterica]|uniref:Uncharacterized protein n=1 Tax=Bondarzewia mesenterica TaxID=1095465 RepID=A0A4S4M0Y0_9AGAM|nr:hypothetical protein EW146_g2379 [Bondarzewia mesenterica]
MAAIAIEDMHRSLRSSARCIKSIGRAHQQQSIEIIKICRSFITRVVSVEYSGVHEKALSRTVEAVENAVAAAATTGGHGSKDTDSKISSAEEKLCEYVETCNSSTMSYYDDEMAGNHDTQIKIKKLLEDARRHDEQSMNKFRSISQRAKRILPCTKATTKYDLVFLQMFISEIKTDYRIPMVFDRDASLEQILWIITARPKLLEPLRITLDRNPQFYRALHETPSLYGHDFTLKALTATSFKETSSEKLYIILNGKSRVFFECGESPRTFTNIWSLRSDDTTRIILRDVRGTLEAAERVGKSITSTPHIWNCGGSSSILNERIFDWMGMLSKALNEGDGVQWLVRAHSSNVVPGNKWKRWSSRHPPSWESSESALARGSDATTMHSTGTHDSGVFRTTGDTPSSPDNRQSLGVTQGGKFRIRLNGSKIRFPEENFKASLSIAGYSSVANSSVTIHPSNANSSHSEETPASSRSTEQYAEQGQRRGGGVDPNGSVSNSIQPTTAQPHATQASGKAPVASQCSPMPSLPAPTRKSWFEKLKKLHASDVNFGNLLDVIQRYAAPVIMSYRYSIHARPSYYKSIFNFVRDRALDDALIFKLWRLDIYPHMREHGETLKPRVARSLSWQISSCMCPGSTLNASSLPLHLKTFLPPIHMPQNLLTDITYDLPPALQSLQKCWLSTLQSAATVSSIFAAVEAQLLVLVKSATTSPSPDSQPQIDPSRPMVKALLIFTYIPLLLSLSVSISSLVLTDEIGGLPFRAARKNNLPLTGKIEESSFDLLKRYGVRKSWGWVMWHWFLSLLLTFFSTLIQVSVYACITESTEVKVISLIAATVAVVPLLHFLPLGG